MNIQRLYPYVGILILSFFLLWLPDTIAIHYFPDDSANITLILRIFCLVALLTFTFAASSRTFPATHLHNGIQAMLDQNYYHTIIPTGHIIHDSLALKLNQLSESLRHLIEAKHTYEEIFENSGSPLVFIAPDTTISMVNCSFERFSGYNREEVLHGFSWTKLVADPDELAEMIHYHKLRRSDPSVAPLSYEFHFLTKSGQHKRVALTIAMLPNTRHSLATLMDVSEIQSLKSALQESDRRFRAIFDQTFQFMGVLDVDGVLQEVNANALSFIHASLEDVRGKPFWETPWWTHDSALQKKLKAAIIQAAHGESTRFETNHRSHLGRLHYIDFSLKPIFSETGQVVMLVPEGHDITERKESELALRESNDLLELKVEKRTQELLQINQTLTDTLDQLRQTQSQLVQSEKMATLGITVAGLAHELNTPLGSGITLASHLNVLHQQVSRLLEGGELKRSDLIDYLSDSSDSSRMLLENLNRAVRLVQNFKQVSAAQSQEKKQLFSVKEYLQEIFLTQSITLEKAAIQVHLNCDEHMIINSYPSAFIHIISQLLSNSFSHAYPAGCPGGQINLHAILKNQLLILTYADDGIGISPDLMEHLFDPFRIGQKANGSTGIGLYIIHHIITQKFGGTIQCESSPGKGTRFTITLPISE